MTVAVTRLAARLVCPRCGRDVPAEPSALVSGCPSCAADGVPVNPSYEPDAGVLRDALAAGRGAGGRMWRWGPALAVHAAADAERWRPVALGEGGTPLIALNGVADALGLADLAAKLESQNPTWSHKDRLCSVAVTAARDAGAEHVVAVSTGNAGASTAAYAAHAGLACTIVGDRDVEPAFVAMVQAFGAELVRCERAERYELARELMRTRGAWPITSVAQPPIGSHALGVDGYKTIAYEIWEELDGAMPDWVAVPVAYGDCLAGIARGFRDLRRAGLVERTPRLLGAELSGALAAGERADGRPLGPVEVAPSAAFSINGAYTTFQAIDAIRRTDGRAWSVGEPDLLSAQQLLARASGVFAEAAAAVPLAAVRAAVDDGLIDRGERIVVIVTSTGLKSVGPFLARPRPGTRRR